MDGYTPDTISIGMDAPLAGSSGVRKTPQVWAMTPWSARGSSGLQKGASCASRAHWGSLKRQN
eukprot:2700726-Pyramimonas_sp.AAC.1